MFAVFTLVAIAIISYFFLKNSSKVQNEPENEPTPPVKTETKKPQKPQKQPKQKPIKPVEFSHETLSLLSRITAIQSTLYRFLKTKNMFYRPQMTEQCVFGS